MKPNHLPQEGYGCRNKCTCILGLHYQAILMQRKKSFENHFMDKAKKLWCYRRFIKKTLCQVFSLCVLQGFRYSSKYFAQNYRTQYGAAMLMNLHETSTWRLENSLTSIKTMVYLWVLDLEHDDVTCKPRIS